MGKLTAPIINYIWSSKRLELKSDSLNKKAAVKSVITIIFRKAILKASVKVIKIKIKVKKTQR